jgi:dephospho-CoA kinase
MGLTIIGVSGAIGAGKSSLAADVAARRGARSVSFGDFVRETASARGLADDRQTLQDLGASLLEEWGADEFSACVVGEKAGTVVVDGVRHVLIDDALRNLADEYLLVFVDVDDAVRQERLDQRQEERAGREEADAHSTERDLPLLRERADVVVDSSGAEAVAAKLTR